jgi:hypothetical protein
MELYVVVLIKYAGMPVSSRLERVKTEMGLDA